MATTAHHPSLPPSPQPAWDVALLFPSQGEWRESDYLALETNQLVELVDGHLEVLPLPTVFHQGIVRFLYKLLDRFIEAGKRGTVYFAPIRIHVRERTFREPDVVYVAAEHYDWIGEKYLTGADLVIKVVSADDRSRARDYEEKRADYAELGIAEYWIVDPHLERVTVLTLVGDEYRVYGEFAAGQQAASVLLDGFAVDVSKVFAAARIVP